MSTSSDNFLMSNLVGGDRKQQTETVLHKFDKKVETFWRDLFNGRGAGHPDEVKHVFCDVFAAHGLMAAAATNNAAGYNAVRPTLSEAIDRFEFLLETKQILEKAVGAYSGAELKEDIGDEIETALDRIKQSFANNNNTSALGSGNRPLAQKAHAALRLLLKDFGDENSTRGISGLLKTYTQTGSEISKAITALANNITAAKHPRSHTGRLRL